jgi:hypothetical protein
MFELVFNPASPAQRRVRFSVSEADIDDAVGYGRAKRDDPLDRQLSDAAYHMVLELQVASIEEVTELPWVILRDGRIIGRNAGAMSVREADLA